MEQCLHWENLVARVLRQHEQLEQRERRITELEDALSRVQTELRAAEERWRLLPDRAGGALPTTSLQVPDMGLKASATDS